MSCNMDPVHMCFVKYPLLCITCTGNHIVWRESSHLLQRCWWEWGQQQQQPNHQQSEHPCLHYERTGKSQIGLVSHTRTHKGWDAALRSSLEMMDCLDRSIQTSHCWLVHLNLAFWWLVHESLSLCWLVHLNSSLCWLVHLNFSLCWLVQQNFCLYCCIQGSTAS